MKQKILIVGGDQAARKSLSEWLAKAGCAVDCAENGEGALDMIRRSRYDAAVIDLKLPGMDGLEALRQAKKCQADIRVIITGSASADDAAQATKSGSDDFLAKPFTPAQLEKAVEALASKKAGPAEAAAAPPAAKAKPAQKEKVCIWAKAGVIAHRVCATNFRCEACDFAQSLIEKGAGASDRSLMAETLRKLLEKPGPSRECRYMLSGDVTYRLCPNLYQCGLCAFDQDMAARLEAEAAKMVGKLKALREKKGSAEARKQETAGKKA